MSSFSIVSKGIAKSGADIQVFFRDKDGKTTEVKVLAMSLSCPGFREAIKLELTLFRADVDFDIDLSAAFINLVEEENSE